jgi:hypothetical protein
MAIFKHPGTTFCSVVVREVEAVVLADKLKRVGRGEDGVVFLAPHANPDLASTEKPLRRCVDNRSGSFGGKNTKVLLETLTLQLGSR